MTHYVAAGGLRDPDGRNTAMPTGRVDYYYPPTQPLSAETHIHYAKQDHTLALLVLGGRLCDLLERLVVVLESKEAK